VLFQTSVGSYKMVMVSMMFSIFTFLHCIHFVNIT